MTENPEKIPLCPYNIQHHSEHLTCITYLSLRATHLTKFLGNIFTALECERTGTQIQVKI